MARGTRRRAGALAALLLGNAAVAGEEEPRLWGAVLEGGQASAPRSQHFAEFAGIAVTREGCLGAHVGLAAEVWPILLFNETRLDGGGRQRVPAAALDGLLTVSIGPRSSQWGFRLEGGVGILWARDPVPAAGSRFNFLDQGGGAVVYRLASAKRLRLGYRRVHVSNLGLAGDNNPGLSFHAVTIAVDF